MSVTSVSNTYTSNQTISVPDNAVNVRVTVQAGTGGSGNGGGSGGQGRVGQFKYNTNFVARSISVYVGAYGSNGSSPGGGQGGGNAGVGRGGTGGNGQYSYQTTTSYSCPQGRGYRRNCGGSCGCCGGEYCGGSQGNGDPCCGGAQGTPNECFCCFVAQTCYNTITTTVNTGGGGGGGSASGFGDNIYGVIAIAGGGGGGGGRNSGGTGANAGQWQSQNGAVGGANGSNGVNRGSGGGTGGGGGGASPSVGWTTGAYSKYNSSAVTLESGQLNTNVPYATVSYDLYTPQITSFSANPANQYSTNGIPQYSSTISFNAQDWERAVLTAPGFSQTYYPGDTLSYNVTNLAQSNAEGTSPTSRTYTLTVYAGSQSTSQSLTINAKNDNTPSNSWTSSFINLEPNTQYDLTLGTLTGVDMPTTISAAGSGNFVGNGGSFSGSKNFDNNSTIQLRTTSLPFNTDLSGLSSTATFGKTNSKTITVTTPSGSFNVTVTTRAPKIKEDFDYASNINKFPFEDIDLITNSPTGYLTSAQIEANDIEIDMEIKADQPDTEVSINGGTWQNVREL